jgi:hypothetical protein
MSLQLVSLVERIFRNSGERRFTGGIYVDVTKVFDTVWVDGILYKLTLSN